MSQEPSSILFDGRTARYKLNILIIGGGIAGMAAAFCLGKAGHHITVIETAPVIMEVGAGIQIGPNMSRLLMRWGLANRLKQFGVKPLSASFRRYCTGERVGFSFAGDTMEFEQGAPYYHLHRADLHSMLAAIATPYMTLRLGSKVISVDPKSVSAFLESGEIISADVILGADGVKSMTRRSIFGGIDERLPTGDAVYRATIPTTEMMKDPLLKSLVAVPEATCWMGPGKHVVGYCIRAKKEYNVVLICPDNLNSPDSDSWTVRGNPDEMRAAFQGWEPRIQRILKLVKEPTTGRLVIRKPLGTWLDPTKRIALIGDACHPMLPYRAQGAAMALEDAAVLGNLFSRISHKHQITPLLEAYEKIRIARTTSTQEASWSNRTTFHLADGAAQEARDNSMRLAMVEILKGVNSSSDGHQGNANMWADREKNFEQFSYDPDEAVNLWWRGDDSISLHRQFAKL
ncbi:FAD/NAD(P)-binding domain-containing protein [Mycena venus]|uniref:FAD/NAD(P)-binding domain-containing protein n=1 Tax=Mycena venus TaxID=2733690 RepID=A0A8H6YH26_9AGAR|nr:FAD/NAD(P)-binding domain-containing protein [Mycena venus]